MLERIEDLPVGIIGLRARGKVSREDYDAVLEPLLEEERAAGRRIRFLYHFPSDFEAFTAGGAWEDARLGLRYLRLFERCAVASDLDWIRGSTRLMGFMMPCPVRVFREAEWKEALAWLEEAPTTTSLTYRLLDAEGVLVLEPHGPLHAEDFDALALAVDPWIETHGGLEGLVIHLERFPGWHNVGGFLRHLRFVRDHHRKVKRIAIAADGKLAELGPGLAEHFLAAEIRPFGYEELDDAIAWAGGGVVETN